MTARQPAPLNRGEALEIRFGRQLTARLNEGADQLPHEVTERLRHARTVSIQRRLVVAQPSPSLAAVIVTSGSASGVFGSGSPSGPSWWPSVSVLLPLVVLLGGFYLIGHQHSREQVSAAAEIDAALLADDLPPDAYGDPGFVEFLKLRRD